MRHNHLQASGNEVTVAYVLTTRNLSHVRLFSTFLRNAATSGNGTSITPRPAKLFMHGHKKCNAIYS